MAKKKNINIFEKDVVRRKKENVVFVPPGRQLFLPVLQCQALEITAGYCPSVHEPELSAGPCAF